MFAKKMFVPFLTFFGLGVFVFGSQEHFDLDPDPKLLSKSFTRPLEILNLEFWKSQVNDLDICLVVKSTFLGLYWL